MWFANPRYLERKNVYIYLILYVSYGYIYIYICYVFAPFFIQFAINIRYYAKHRKMSHLAIFRLFSYQKMIQIQLMSHYFLASLIRLILKPPS